MYTLDRFEGEIAVLENRQTGEMINVKRNLIPESAKEGDILKLENEIYIIDEPETQTQKEYIKSLMEKLRKK